MSIHSKSRIGLALALAMLHHGSTSANEQGFTQRDFGAAMVHRMRNHYKSVPSGKPTGAARAKRIARKHRNIRARSAK